MFQTSPPTTTPVPSNAVHVELCVNLSGPPDKAKYYLATDSDVDARGLRAEALHLVKSGKPIVANDYPLAQAA
jgi:hypothetical protein